jgi:beta-phosphoglucomutase family hydrolase
VSRAITPERFDAVLFDMDGVLTDTSRPHAASWKAMFDPWLAARPPRAGEDLRPYDTREEYRRHAEGRLRYDGVRSFLEARGISMPEGSPDDPPERETICGLGNRKNVIVLEMMRTGGVDAYPDAVDLAGAIRAAGLQVAVVSVSHNVESVLQAAGLAGRFELIVDGNEVDRLGLPGKPDPAPYLLASRLLGVDPARAVVIEDAEAGVRAGVAGGFGLVVGVDRHGDAAALRAAGAHLVVIDLSGLA